MRRRFTHLQRRHPGFGALRIDALIAGYCILTLGIAMLTGSFRAPTYVIPVLVVLAMLATRQFTLSPNAPPYLVLMAGAMATAPLISGAGYQDLYLMLIGISPFLFGYRYRITWKQVFWASVVATLIAFVMKRQGFGGNIEFDPMTSKSTFEATTSFVFGVLAVWAATQRRWRAALVALILCALTLKRIAMLGAMVSIVVLLLPRVVMDRVLRPVPMLIANALFLVVVVMYTQGAFDHFIFAWTDQSPNQFGMGRQNRYGRPVEAVLADPWRFAFLGMGAGGIYDLMKGGWDFLPKLSLHNDSLKILVEYGGIVWVAFFAVLYRPSQDFRIRVLMLFQNVMLLTDNTLIYSYVIFLIGLAAKAIVDPPVERVPGGAEPPAGRPASGPWHKTSPTPLMPAVARNKWPARG